MQRNTTPATRGTSSGPVPYTGPLYTRHGREITPAAPRFPVRPC